MKIAAVCDWLTGMRGGERCLKALCDLYPQADIYTLVYYPENFNGEFNTHRVTPSFIQKLPGNHRTFRKYLPFFPRAIESFDLTDYDLVISFSHCVAKSVKTPDSVQHICYCHTPIRYAWDMRTQYLASVHPLKRPFIHLLLNHLKSWDQKTSHRPDHFIANSEYVKQRIQRCYHRDATVIYPPVEVSRFPVSQNCQDYYLVLSALVPYKRVDLAIEAFNQSGRRLVVAGSGPERQALGKLANENIEFIDNPSDEIVAQLYADCKALIFPGEEDFGIVPLEVQACGKPVIAYGKGGALETVVDMSVSACHDPTGLFFAQQTTDSLLKALDFFEKNQKSITPAACRANAVRFDTQRYKEQMKKFIDDIQSSS